MTRKNSLRLSLLASAAALLLSAPARAEVPTVVTDIPAVGALVQQVLGDLGQPEVLLGNGGDPHNYQLRPSQARNLQSAGLLVWIGPELSPWLSRPVEGLDAAVSMPLLHLPGTKLREYGAVEAHDHDHDHEHSGDEEGHEGHDHSGTDPHAWLDPANGQLWLTAIAEALATRDPENATSYRDNAKAGVAAIGALDSQLTQALAPAKGQKFVVFHDAYGYFTAHYGLQPGIAVSLGDASAPSAARLRDIRQQIASEQAVCAFPEANHDPKLLQVAIEGTNTRLGAALDPEGTKLELGAGLYGGILQGIGTALADCLSAK